MPARDLTVGPALQSLRSSMGLKTRMYVSEWPGLHPTSLLERPRCANLPFPLSAPNGLYFFRARNAIYHLVRSLGLVQEGKILVPDYHSGSEVWAIRAAGAAVCYYHIGRDLQPDLAQVRRLCESEKPRALLTIHYNGWSQPIEDLAELCAERQITLIEDCAHAMLSANVDRPLGTYGHYSVFCLYKSLPVPNGGLLLCNGEVPEALTRLDLQPAGMLSVSGRTAELLLTWLRSRAFGVATSMSALKRNAGRLLNAVHLTRLPIGEVGFDLRAVNAAISPLSLSLLETFDYQEIVRRRRHNFLYLRQRLAGRAELLRHDLPDGMCPLFFPLLVSDKPTAAAALRMRGIAAVETWNYGDGQARGSQFADAQFLRDHVLELPIHPDLTTEQLEYMAGQVMNLNLRPPGFSH